jgi:hypothetical protein
MQILGLLGLYFDAVVVFFTSHSILFRLIHAILWTGPMTDQISNSV